MTEIPGATEDKPLFVKWIEDDDGEIRWGRVLLALALTVATAYLSMATQRAAGSPDLHKTIAMGAARKRITLGVKLQRAGKAIEDAGWAAYEAARG